MATLSPELEALRFERLVADLEVDDARRVRRMAKTYAARRCYIILFSARSGSSWLGSLLTATELLGKPREYLNPEMVVKTAKQLDARTAEDALQMLLRIKQSPNGVFGMKVRAIDIELFGESLFIDTLGARAVFFHLWRENLVAQGISLYRAVASRRFHSNSVSQVREPPAYDGAEILHWIRHVAASENDNVRLLRRHDIAARPLIYEQITHDRVGVIRLFAQAMAVPYAPGDFMEAGSDELAKVGDDWNDEVEARFRGDYADALTVIEADRLTPARAGEGR